MIEQRIDVDNRATIFKYVGAISYPSLIGEDDYFARQKLYLKYPFNFLKHNS